MTQQTNIFPLFFKLEKVNNGYILTSAPETDGVKDSVFVKEIVTEDKINSRIGQLLQLNTLKKEKPVMFHVEAVGETTYKFTEEGSAEDLMVAKLAYIHFHQQNIKDGSTLVLNIKDTGTLEIYGLEAERAAKKNGIPLNRMRGIPLLSFPSSKEGQKSLASYVGKISLNDVTHKKIMEWYESRKVLVEK